MSSSFTLYGIDIEQLRRAVSQSPAVHSADSLKALCTAKGELVQLDLLEHSAGLYLFEVFGDSVFETAFLQHNPPLPIDNSNSSSVVGYMTAVQIANAIANWDESWEDHPQREVRAARFELKEVLEFIREKGLGLVSFYG